MSQVFSEQTEIAGWQRIATLLGTDCLPEEFPAQVLAGFPSIQNLIRTFASARPELIDHQSCEMVDAELVNQGLVVEPPPAWLSQLFAQEIALLRWRARRMNAEPASLSFAIDIRQYVAVSALEVASLQLERRGLSFKDSGLKDTDAKRVDRRVLTWSTIIDNEGDAEKQLAYFEAVASLFDSKHSADQDPVNRGLRLVIQMIVQSGELKQKENLIVLPTSQAQFLAGIR